MYRTKTGKFIKSGDETIPKITEYFSYIGQDGKNYEKKFRANKVTYFKAGRLVTKIRVECCGVHSIVCFEDLNFRTL